MATTHYTPSRVPVLLAVVAIGFALLLATASAAFGSSQPPPEPVPYVVQAGDTLWSVTQSEYGTTVDARQIIYAIKRLTDLEGASLSIGQVLLLPAS